MSNLIMGLKCNTTLIKNFGTRRLANLPSPSFKCNELYDMAVEKLNCMPMTDAVVQKFNPKGDEPNRNINGTRIILENIGTTVADLSKLNVIHIAGSKGKSSTGVLTEQFLKSLGFKTGFYSSPHLFKVNERIRINGIPLSDDLFAQYFLQIYWPAMRRRVHEVEKGIPNYFNFLTAMAYYVFLEERVDVAIVETGFGGKYDATNLLPHTKIVGITPILHDNTNLIGDTIAELAWHNSEIIKDKSNVFISRQEPKCMEVINNVALKCNAKLQVVPKFDEYKTRVNFRIPDSIQRLNASLAIQLAYNWIRYYKNSIPKRILSKVDFLFDEPKKQCPTVVPNEFINPLQTCSWPGRYEKLYLRNKTIYFDCGESSDCIKISTEWFNNNTRQNHNPKCLIFSGFVNSDEDSIKSLRILYDHLHLDLVYFTPNYRYAMNILIDNTARSRGAYDSQLSKCYDLLKIWCNIRNSSANYNDAKVMVKPCISTCFENFHEIYNNDQIDIFVTGSLNLIVETFKYLNHNN